LLPCMLLNALLALCKIVPRKERPSVLCFCVRRRYLFRPLFCF